MSDHAREILVRDDLPMFMDSVSRYFPCVQARCIKTLSGVEM